MKRNGILIDRLVISRRNIHVYVSLSSRLFSLLYSQLARKKDQEISKLRSHLEALSNENEEAVMSVSKKFNTQLLQVQEDIETIRKAKARFVWKQLLFNLYP